MKILTKLIHIKYISQNSISRMSLKSLILRKVIIQVKKDNEKINGIIDVICFMRRKKYIYNRNNYIEHENKYN